MSKAILKYDLSDPDDRLAHIRAVRSLDMACVLFEIQHNVKRKIEARLESTKLQPDPFQTLDWTMEFIMEEYSNFNININELID